MEIEFEWYSVYLHLLEITPESGSIKSTILFPNTSLNDADDESSLFLCLGTIKSYKVLPPNAPLNYPLVIASFKDSDESEILH